MKKYYAVALLILLFSIALRLQFTAYPNGQDSVTNFKLINDITETKYVRWVLSPLSLTGFYPLSYQTGALVYLSTLTSISGLDLKITYIIFDLLFLILIGIFIYLLSKKITEDKPIALICVLVILNTRLIYYFSNWFFSTRNLFLIFFMFFLYVLLNEKMKYRIGLLILATGVMTITHKLILILPLLLVAYLLAKMLHRHKIINNRFTLLLLTISVFAASIIFLKTISLGPLAEAPIRTNIVIINSALDTIFRFVLQIGIPSIFSVMGYIVLSLKKNKSFIDIFLLFVLLIFSPLLIEQTYVSFILLPIMIMLMTVSFAFMFSKKNNKITRIAFSYFIVIALIAPLYVTLAPNLNDEALTRPQTISLEKYSVRQNVSKTILCNLHDYYCNQITAFSNNQLKTISASYQLIDPVFFKDNSIKYKLGLKKWFQITDPVLNQPFVETSHQDYLVKYRIGDQVLNRLVSFNKIGYILDPNRMDSSANDKLMEEKFPMRNEIYDNGLEKLSTLRSST